MFHLFLTSSPASCYSAKDDCFPWLLSAVINEAASWEAAKCQNQQLTNTSKTCDIYLMLSHFEKACSILKVKRAAYLKDNHFSLLHNNTIRPLNLHSSHMNGQIHVLYSNATLTAATSNQQRNHSSFVQLLTTQATEFLGD